MILMIQMMQMMTKNVQQHHGRIVNRSCIQTRQRHFAVTSIMNVQYNRLFSSVEQVEEDRGTSSSASTTTAATKSTMTVPFSGSKEEIIKEEQKRKRLAEVSITKIHAHSNSYSRSHSYSYSFPIRKVLNPSIPGKGSKYSIERTNKAKLTQHIHYCRSPLKTSSKPSIPSDGSILSFHKLRPSEMPLPHALKEALLA